MNIDTETLDRAELFLAATAAKQTTKALDQHRRECVKCKTQAFGMCETALKFQQHQTTKGNP